MFLKSQVVESSTSANHYKKANLKITHHTFATRFFSVIYLTSDDGGLRDQKNIIRHNGIMHTMPAMTNTT
jgi:hypothetical protein